MCRTGDTRRCRSSVLASGDEAGADRRAASTAGRPVISRSAASAISADGPGPRSLNDLAMSPVQRAPDDQRTSYEACAFVRCCCWLIEPAITPVGRLTLAVPSGWRRTLLDGYTPRTPST